MAHIDFQKVSLDFPIYNARTRSLKNKLFSSAAGGRTSENNSTFVVVKSLNNVSFTINSGEKVGIIGHNGAGKTTLLRALSGVYSPTLGQLAIQGTVGSLIDLTLGLNPEATGRENIIIRSALLGLTRKQTLEVFPEIVAFSELGDYIEMPLRTYSSGMLLRLAFAVSTVINPDILLMDEWLSVGDENFTTKAEAKVNELLSNSKILVIASHSRHLLERICTRIIWLEHGSVVMDGNVNEVLHSYFGEQ